MLAGCNLCFKAQALRDWISPVNPVAMDLGQVAKLAPSPCLCHLSQIFHASNMATEFAALNLALESSNYRLNRLIVI